MHHVGASSSFLHAGICRLRDSLGFLSARVRLPFGSWAERSPCSPRVNSWQTSVPQSDRQGRSVIVGGVDIGKCRSSSGFDVWQSARA